MSQSDYIEHKRRALVLKTQNKLPSILTSDQYIGFKQFAAKNNIVNTSPEYNELIPAGTKVIFDVVLNNTANCSTFIVDKNTQTRPNRVITLPPNLNIIQPATYVKFPKVVCAKCADSSTDDLLVTDSDNNTNLTLNRINRLKNKLCQCASLR
jgi:hypothetical protein